jgi:predicted RNase H-like HicB family nuclease/DNA-binding Xre family transcriptional regulator
MYTVFYLFLSKILYNAGKQTKEASVNHVGEAIRYYRGLEGWTQEHLAHEAGLAPTSIVRLENGEIKHPRISTLTKLAQALTINPNEFLRFVMNVPGDPATPAKHPEPLEAGNVGTFTAIYELTEDGWWVVSVPEIPGAHSQGETLEEAREMIRDAVRMLLEVRREDAERETEGKKNVVREPLEV